MAWKNLCKLRENIKALVHAELGDDVRVYVEISEPPKRHVRVEVVDAEGKREELIEWRGGVPWQEN